MLKQIFSKPVSVPAETVFQFAYYTRLVLFLFNRFIQVPFRSELHSRAAFWFCEFAVICALLASFYSCFLQRYITSFPFFSAYLTVFLVPPRFPSYTALTLPMAKARGFLAQRPLPAHARSYIVSPSVRFGHALPYHALYTTRTPDI